MNLDFSKYELNLQAGVMTGIFGAVLGLALQSTGVAFWFIVIGVGMASVNVEESGVNKRYLQIITLLTFLGSIALLGFHFGRFLRLIF